MSVIARQYIEKQIARRLVEDLVAAGYRIGRVDCCGTRHGAGHSCGEENLAAASPGTNNVDQVLAAMFKGDDDHVYVNDARGNYVGWIWLIYGNGGDDVISDYSVDLDRIVEPVYAWVDAGLPPREPSPLAALVAAVESKNDRRAAEILDALSNEQLDTLLTDVRGGLAGKIVAALDRKRVQL